VPCSAFDSDLKLESESEGVVDYGVGKVISNDLIASMSVILIDDVLTLGTQRI
jgi:hypothetical protein